MREIAGIVMPDVGTKQEFDAAAIAELAVIDKVRNVLLGEGKYLGMRGGDYYILMPSENEAQVRAYMEQADKKLRRARRLLKSMPVTAATVVPNIEARIEMKRDDIGRFRSSAARAVDSPRHALHA